MEQKQFLEKLSEVATWEFRDVKTPTPQGLKQPVDLRTLETPKELIVTSIKASPCPYKDEQQGCFFKINFWTVNNYSKKKVRVIKCETCGHIITPKGHYINPDDNVNLAYFSLKYDREN